MKPCCEKWKRSSLRNRWRQDASEGNYCPECGAILKQKEKLLDEVQDVCNQSKIEEIYKDICEESIDYFNEICKEAVEKVKKSRQIKIPDRLTIGAGQIAILATINKLICAVHQLAERGER